MMNLGCSLGGIACGILIALALLRPESQPIEPGRAAPPAKISGQIQWFATWQSGLKEAQRLNRPILLVASAPHCAGVSGVW